MSRKKWNICSYDKNAASALALKTGADDFAVLLLQSRGIRTADAVIDFLGAADGELSSPFLLKDMEKAVKRIRQAIEYGERILVYGDYDADGVTATALLSSYLESVGAMVSSRIPSRLKEGYGLSPDTAREIAESGVNLIITVDNGIASVEEAEIFKEYNVDFIVTDHHKVGAVLPDALAVIDPHREDDTSPEENLAGVGVALKLAAALEDGDYTAVFEDMGDLAAIGTVADIVPLTGENRIIVAKGLEVLKNSCRPGLISLLEAAGVKSEINGNCVAFSLAPRINAAGRMGSADTALRLLLCEDEDEAQEIAEELCSLNAMRQSVESGISEEIEQYFEENPSFKKDMVLVAAGEGWHPGVIGIAASRFCEKYGRPAIVISVDENGIARGSGRSIDGFSLYDALSYCSDELLQFGGHTLAAGFSVKKENIDTFRKKINEYAASLPPFYPSINVDVRLNPQYVSTAILDSLALLEPFGAENPPPVFGLFNMVVSSIKPIGSDKHIRVTLSKDNVSVPAVYFGQTAESFPFVQGDRVDVAVRIEKNEYRGEVRPSVQIKDIRPVGENDDSLFFSLFEYSRFASGQSLSEDSRALICPDRRLLGDVYRFIKEKKQWKFSPEMLCMRIGCGYERAGAVSVSLDALCEVGVLINENGEYMPASIAGKADLSESTILKKLGYC